MSLQALCGEPAVDEHIRKVACTAQCVGIQRFYYFVRLLFHRVYDYVCGAERQYKALSFLDQEVLHCIKRNIRIWIPDTERLKMSAAEVEGGEGHLACLKTALVNHEKALYRERIKCYDEMFAAHEERQQSKIQSSLEWALVRGAESSRSSSEVEDSPTQPSEMVMVESASGNSLLSDEE